VRLWNDFAIAFGKFAEGGLEAGFAFAGEDVLFGGASLVGRGGRLIGLEREHEAGDDGADVAVEFGKRGGSGGGGGCLIGEVFVGAGDGEKVMVLLGGEPGGFADGVVDGAANAVVSEGFELDAGTRVERSGGFDEAEFGGALELGAIDAGGELFGDIGRDGVRVGAVGFDQAIHEGAVVGHASESLRRGRPLRDRALGRHSAGRAQSGSCEKCESNPVGSALCDLKDAQWNPNSFFDSATRARLGRARNFP
jgi:hypothetical protein